MKKSFLLIGIFLITLNINAQDKQTEFGIKGGLNYSSFVDNNDDDIPADYKGKIGFHVGGFVRFEISEKISLRPELLYSQQGSEFSINVADLIIFDPNGDIFNTSIDGEIKESLLLLPINLEYGLSEKFNFEFGPQFGFSLNRKVEFEDNPLDVGIRNDDEEKFEIGLGLGLGYSLTDELGISLRYNYGIIERQNLNTSVFQLGMNYKL